MLADANADCLREDQFLKHQRTTIYADMPSETVPCPVCGCLQFELLTRVDRYRMGVATCQCRDCGLVMTNPMPSEAALGKFYRDDYRLYYRKVERPSPDHSKKFGLTERAQYTAAFMKQAELLTGSPQILDVGCAEGSLLRAIGAIAPSSVRVGIEPNPHFGDFARTWAGAKVYSDLSEIEQTDLRFTLIIVNHVLEHIREPVAFLRRLSALLQPGGAIYVDVPDVTHYHSVDDLHLAHLYHFSPTSLTNLARQAGLGLRKLEQHSPPHHPRSVRTVLEPGGEARARATDPDASLARQRVEQVAAKAPMYFLRRSLLGRIVVGPPMRLWRAVRALRAE